jgi:hypothetical protein
MVSSSTSRWKASARRLRFSSTDAFSDTASAAVGPTTILSM